MRRFLMHFALVALSLLSTGIIHAEERPFNGRGSGRLEYGRTGMLVGEIQATHLGKSGLVVTFDEFELAEGNLVPIALAIYGGSDVLFAAVDASFDPERGIIAGTINFAGGTRRFADATGSASLLIVFDEWTGLFGNPLFDFISEGIIHY